MARPEKVQAVADIKDRIENAKAVFVAEYAGLSVKSQQALRRALRAGGSEFKIVKMTLARRAVDELSIEGFGELLLGPTGLVYADGDAVTAAKALKEFSKENEALIVKGGLLGNELLAPERVSQLADIESREVLLAKLAGAAKAPMSNMAGLMSALLRNTASLVKALADKRVDEGETPAPVAEPAADVEAEAADDAPEVEASADEATADEAADDATETTDDQTTETTDEPAAAAEEE